MSKEVLQFMTSIGYSLLSNKKSIICSFYIQRAVYNFWLLFGVSAQMVGASARQQQRVFFECDCAVGPPKLTLLLLFGVRRPSQCKLQIAKSKQKCKKCLKEIEIKNEGKA